MKGWLTALFLAASLAAVACRWDSDTLYAEARGLPDVAEALVGRIDVNPPLYYEMRLERASKAIASGKTDPELFDDAAMACDVLGRSDEALDWLAKKEKMLPQWGDLHKGDPLRDPTYRFYANRGTVRAHSWARSGAGDDLGMLQDGIADLEKAVQLNPKAHFGREAVQIEILKRFRDERMAGGHGSWESTNWPEFVKKNGRRETIQGIIGMMTVGAGDRSPDLVFLLGMSLDMNDAILGYSALLRVNELVRAGAKPVSEYPLKEEHMAVAMVASDRRAVIERQFSDLRKQADKINAAREAYMLAKLEAGEHPDTHPNFWEGYKEQKLNVPQEPPKQRPVTNLFIIYGVVSVIGVMVVGWLVMNKRLGRP